MNNKMRARSNSFWLFMEAVALIVLLLPTPFAAANEQACCLPILDDDAACNRMPPLKEGLRQPLPVWARMLADSLPRTTAAMLELDARHRHLSPLGVVLASKVRWTVAQANRCAYSVACAEGDWAIPRCCSRSRAWTRNL